MSIILLEVWHVSDCWLIYALLPFQFGFEEHFHPNLDMCAPNSPLVNNHMNATFKGLL